MDYHRFKALHIQMNACSLLCLCGEYGGSCLKALYLWQKPTFEGMTSYTVNKQHVQAKKTINGMKKLYKTYVI